MDQQYKTASGKTIRKVQASSYAAAVAAILTFLLNTYVFKGTPLPDWFESALSLIVSGALTGASAWIAGYVTRPRRGDTVVPDRGQPPPLESSIG